jgi:menaquinone-9 beta-reductase
MSTAVLHKPDALIVGGGPTGAALGIRLARSGRAVELVEQTTGPHHKVCGEFLSREAVAYLETLGLNLRTLGAVPIHGVRLAARRRTIAACDLPFSALSLTRRALDETLLALAAQAGANVIRGCRVDSLDPSKTGWTAQLANGEIRHASAAFLATGKHDLAGHRRPPGAQNDLIAFKMYFQLAPAQQHALHGWVEILLFPGGYAGLQMVEENHANLCLLVERKTLRACGNHWQEFFAYLVRSSDALAERLESAQPLLAKPLALSFIPYGLLSSSSPSGLWRLGDQAAVIPSFSGDGISIALHSARLAADLYATGAPSAGFAHQLHRELRHSVQLATTLSRLMIAAPALAHAARLWPTLLRLIAAHTRIPSAAWLPAAFPAHS